jgi:hypothetical protein
MCCWMEAVEDTRMTSLTTRLLGEDGRDYEFVWRLEACSAWHAWLGDDHHPFKEVHWRNILLGLI